MTNKKQKKAVARSIHVTKLANERRNKSNLQKRKEARTMSSLLHSADETLRVRHLLANLNKTYEGVQA